MPSAPPGTGVSGAIVAAGIRATGGPAQGLAVAFGVGFAVVLLGQPWPGDCNPHRTVAAPVPCGRLRSRAAAQAAPRPDHGRPSIDVR